MTSAIQRNNDIIEELRKQRRYDCTTLPTLPPLHDPQQHPSRERQHILLELYKEICTSWRALVDVSFKLLIFVPAASTAILTALFVIQPLQRMPYIQTGIALFGLFVIIGLSIYDKRNSELLDDLMNRACKVENELGIDTGQFHGRLKPSQKMLLIPVIPQWLNTFKLPAGKEFMLQLPENTPAHVVKNAALQLPKGSTLQLLDDICELPLPPNAALQLPKGSTLQLPKNSSLLLLKGDRLQLLDDFVLQLSENSSTPVLKSSTLRLPEDYTWHQLKNSKLLYSHCTCQQNPACSCWTIQRYTCK